MSTRPNQVDGANRGEASAGAPITVLLADDHSLVRDALHLVLESQPDIRVVGAVGSGRQAVLEAARLAPQVVVIDISMPDVDGIEATRRIAAAAPATAVLVVSTHGDVATVRRALAAGALGYLPKGGSGAEVISAVRSVVAGRRYLGKGLSAQLGDVLGAVDRGDAALQNLTPTEREILRLVASGKSNAEIGTLLGLSRRTVETYRQRLMQKLGLENLPALVKFAIRHGIVTLD